MKKRIFFLCLILVCTLGMAAKKTKQGTRSNDDSRVFTGVISYYGKVTRIPDRSLSKAKLGDTDSNFKLYMNRNFTKRIESFEGITITITEGINQDIYYQTISTPEDNTLIVATLQEQRDFQLTAKTVRYASVRVREMSGKKKINGYECRKAVCDMVTEDNVRIQLIAWYAPELQIPHYRVPFFGELKGLPLLYDCYNGEHVVTYNSTSVKRQDVSDRFFDLPTDVEPISMTEYIRRVQTGNSEE
ncbi:MAG: hypothetical protein LBR81_02830 [Prevotellaceae bacterium]|nr:hypothetical protein [Prevotellaceae bacterium]